MSVYYIIEYRLWTLTTSSTGSSNISDPSSCSPLTANCWDSVNDGGGVDDRLELLLLFSKQKKS